MKKLLLILIALPMIGFAQHPTNLASSNITTKADISIIMKNENYLLNLHKIIPLWYEDVQ